MVTAPATGNINYINWVKQQTAIPEFEKNGLVFTADSDDGKRMEILEIPSHKFYLGVQFHPEFNSRPGFPEEAFSAFIKASSKK